MKAVAITELAGLGQWNRDFLSVWVTQTTLVGCSEKWKELVQGGIESKGKNGWGVVKIAHLYLYNKTAKMTT